MNASPNLTHGSLFSGMGGFDLAADWAGWTNIFHCEWNEFGKQILNYYWPKAISHHDITKTDFNIYRGRIDVLTGGFPCQPYSTAGKRLGKEDDRHLWPEMLRAVREIQPRWIVGENVLGIVNWNDGLVFQEVQADLETEGYQVQSFVLPAASVNAPHGRNRTWFIAYSQHAGQTTNGGTSQATTREVWRNEERTVPGSFPSDGTAPDSNSNRQPGEEYREEKSEINPQDGQREWFKHFPTQSPICAGDDGLPSGLDGITFPKWRNESIKAAGNAVVPQLVIQIFEAINQYETL